MTEEDKIALELLPSVIIANGVDGMARQGTLIEHAYTLAKLVIMKRADE